MQVRESISKKSIYSSDLVYSISKFPLEFKCQDNSQEIKKLGGPGKPCPDHEVRFCCESLTDNDSCTMGSYTWSPWYNEDDPSNGGDFERIRDISEKGRLSQNCKDPILVQARLSDGRDYRVSEAEVTLDLDGLVCENSNENVCDDFEVRFCCRHEGKLPCARRPTQNSVTNPLWIKPDACCGENPFNTAMHRCCDGEYLVEIEETC